MAMPPCSQPLVATGRDSETWTGVPCLNGVALTAVRISPINSRMNRVVPCVFLSLSTSFVLTAADVMKIENREGRMIEVTVLAVENEFVRVRKADGKEFNIPLSSLSEESVKQVKAMEVATAPTGDAGPVVKAKTEPLSAEEKTLLESLYPAMDKCLYAEMLNPGDPKALALRTEFDAILQSLAKIHGQLGVQDRCERLLAIIRHQLDGGSLPASNGAASSLTQIKGPEATATMFEALAGNLSEAAEIECQRGLAERCTGEVMDKLLTMFMSTDPKIKANGGFTLAKIPTRAQLDELREKAATVVNTAEAKDRLQAVFTLTRNAR